jgi:Phytanoyl-CoA dioxygenase (PhyH)
MKMEFIEQLLRVNTARVKFFKFLMKIMNNKEKYHWNEEVKYFFDLNGYYVFKNYFNDNFIENLRAGIEEIENNSTLNNAACHGKVRTNEMMYISNIAEQSVEFESLISDKLINECVSNLMGGYYRFNHSYAISHWRGGYTTMHMGGAPIHPKALYQVKGGNIFSSLTKAVIPLSNHTKDDGCFCVVPGSHKSEFEYGNRFNLLNPSNHPNCVPLEASPGDLIIFTEALQHGGLENVSGRVRRTVYYCYSLGNVVDWGGDLNLFCSNRLTESDNEEIRRIVEVKGRL